MNKEGLTGQVCGCQEPGFCSWRKQRSTPHSCIQTLQWLPVALSHTPRHVRVGHDLWLLLFLIFQRPVPRVPAPLLFLFLTRPLSSAASLSALTFILTYPPLSWHCLIITGLQRPSLPTLAKDPLPHTSFLLSAASVTLCNAIVCAHVCLFLVCFLNKTVDVMG